LVCSELKAGAFPTTIIFPSPFNGFIGSSSTWWENLFIGSLPFEPGEFAG